MLQRVAFTEVHEQQTDLRPNLTGYIWNTLKKTHPKTKQKHPPQPDPLLLIARGMDGSAQIQGTVYSFHPQNSGFIHHAYLEQALFHERDGLWEC